MIESPIIEKQKKFTYPLSFAFTFEKGEHKGESYQGHLDICSNPICPCRAVNFVITDIDKDKTDNVSKRKIGRNEPCPYGSGKKYKICCGR